MHSIYPAHRTHVPRSPLPHLKRRHLGSFPGTALHSFENKYGRTPDILQVAFPDLSGNNKGYFAPKPVLTHCGQRLEADFCESEFNDLNSIDETTEPPLTSTQRAKLEKLKTFGGAIAGYVNIDCYTGKADGILVNSMAKPLPLVKSTVQAFKAKGQSLLTRGITRSKSSPPIKGCSANHSSA